jgi:hypothetical protein
MLDMIWDYLNSKMENGEDFESIQNGENIEEQIANGSPILSVEYRYYSKNGNPMHGDMKINAFQMMGFIYSSCKNKEHENEDYEPR